MDKRQWLVAMLLVSSALTANVLANNDIESNLSEESKEVLMKDLDLLKICLEKGMKPSNYLLHRAIEGGNLPAIELFDSFGADIDHRDLYSAVNLAIRNRYNFWYQKYIQIIKYFLDRGVDQFSAVPYQKNGKNVTSSPFDVALKSGNQQIIDMFKESIKNSVQSPQLVS